MIAKGNVEAKVTACFMSTLGGEDGKTSINAWFAEVYIGGVSYLCKDSTYPRGYIEAETKKEAIRLGKIFRDRLIEKEKAA